jgi:hypothetical protein
MWDRQQLLVAFLVCGRQRKIHRQVDDKIAREQALRHGSMAGGKPQHVKRCLIEQVVATRRQSLQRAWPPTSGYVKSENCPTGQSLDTNAARLAEGTAESCGRLAELPVVSPQLGDINTAY